MKFKKFDYKVKKRHSMRLAYSILVFVILASASAIIAGLMYILNVTDLHIFERLRPYSLLLLTLAASIIIGTFLSFLIGRNFLSPIKEMISATKKIADGDFSVRVSETKFPKEMNLLSRSFNTMADELGSTEMFRNDFINNFSHEFKTPIVSISGFAKQLKKPDITDEERTEYADIIIAESRRLTTMASNILLLTKYENQQIVTDKTEFYLDEQIRKCILYLEKEWSAKNIDFDLGLEEIKYNFNEDMLSHVWMNIINNAIKFSPENGTITVKCINDISDVMVIISDEGIGMDDETRRHIFDKFYQGDTSHTAQGNGLGLSLAKRVVDLCGGKISVKSRPGAGTTFSVRLPKQ